MSKGDLTRTKILDQAVSLASRWGFEGLTLGVLASSLGLSKSGLYAHFRSKEALILAVLDITLQRHAEHAGPYLHGQAAGMATLRAYLRAWFDWIGHPDLPAGCPILGASFEFETIEGVPRDRLLEIHRMSRERIKTFIRAAVASGELLESTPVEQVEFELRATALALHYSSRFMQDPDARRLAEASVEQLLGRYSNLDEQ